MKLHLKKSTSRGLANMKGWGCRTHKKIKRFPHDQDAIIEASEFSGESTVETEGQRKIHTTSAAAGMIADSAITACLRCHLPGGTARFRHRWHAVKALKTAPRCTVLVLGAAPSAVKAAAPLPGSQKAILGLQSRPSLKPSGLAAPPALRKRDLKGGHQNFSSVCQSP